MSETASASPSSAELAEYESQLAEINLLLEETPHDESLVKLKNDLHELIELTNSGGDTTSDAGQTAELTTAAGQEGATSGGSAACASNYADAHASSTDAVPRIDSNTTSTIGTATHDSAVSINPPAGTGNDAPNDDTPVDEDGQRQTAAAAAKPRKKSKTTPSRTKTTKILSATFEIPPDLLPLPSDTDAIKNKKRRKIRALKSNFRSRQKSAETDVKQRSWLDFKGKGGKRKKSKGGLDPGGGEKGGSIFRTEDGIGARVGVISGSVSVKGVQRESRHTAGTGGGVGVKRSRHTF